MRISVLNCDLRLALKLPQLFISIHLGLLASTIRSLLLTEIATIDCFRSEDFVTQASSSLMMFAELAAERLRQETELRQRSTSGPTPNSTMAGSPRPSALPLVRTSSGNTLLKPQAQVGNQILSGSLSGCLEHR